MALTKKSVDPKLAQDIEDDINEIDGDEPSEASEPKSKVKTVPCPDCADSTIGPGLLDAFTQCPNCGGTGKVAELD